MSRYSVIRTLVPPRRLPVASTELIDYLHHVREVHAQPLQPSPGFQNLTRYVAAAVEGECAQVGSAHEGRRNITLNIAAVKLGSLVGAGMLDEQIAFDALLNASEQCGLPNWEAQKTISSGLAFGKANPRQIEAKDGK